MRKLALSDKILLKVDKAARYIGGEVNSVMKDKNEVDIRFAMCFPDVYEIGMSNLGMMILYNMFNQREDVWCERLFSPWPDLDKVMREQNIPLFALESQEPIRDFDFLGITLGYEMCYTNILQVLDLSGIPLKSADRGEDFPIVIGGGACAYNPEPLAPFFDLFYIGEGETVYDALFDAYKYIPFGVPFDIPYRENWDIPLKMITYNFEMIKNDCHFEMKSHRLIIERRFFASGGPGCFVCNTDKR